ncbi:YwqG family protein [Solirubrobacter phytolaccae]|uniref:YwqG family protein n=1 Tax=Solirubrobacter phytolaccae TaxID=1404360 RepID=A0A9X3N8B6_9ACTN|nr:DUF1963 domain-containing protein [Solirubrobacter phytolaccae]MDA0181643.1 YwqG family protein [Solirubrobacter phytolaccae]
MPWQAEQRAVLARVPFRVFAPEGLPVELAAYGGLGSGPDVVHLRHDTDARELDVDSGTNGGPGVVERLEDDDDEIVSTTRPLMVDGVERPFAFASAGDRWAAKARVGDVVIAVEARGFDPAEVKLRGLVDPTQVVSGTPEYVPLRPAFSPLDPSRVTELGDREAADAARPALALLASNAPQPSWIGGTPHLPDDTPWPEGRYGPMTFIAQLALATLDPAVWIGPQAGHLHIFCDVEPESLSVDDADACLVLHSPADAVLHECDFPPDLHEEGYLADQPVVPSAGLTVPQHSDALWTLQDRLAAEQGWRSPAGQILGWARWQGGLDMNSLARLGGGKGEDWSLLLQADAFDAGELYVVLPTADLRAGRFDRVQASLAHD